MTEHYITCHIYRYTQPLTLISHNLHNTSHSQAIYIILLLAICAFAALLFFITADVNVQSRGVITTTNRQSDAISAMYGKVFSPNIPLVIATRLPFQIFDKLALLQTETHTPTNRNSRATKYTLQTIAAIQP